MRNLEGAEFEGVSTKDVAKKSSPVRNLNLPAVHGGSDAPLHEIAAAIFAARAPRQLQRLRICG